MAKRFTMEQPLDSKGKEQGARFYDCSPTCARMMAKQYMYRYGIERASLRWEEQDAFGEWKTISVISLTK